jgi:hypothetical protein
MPPVGRWEGAAKGVRRWPCLHGTKARPRSAHLEKSSTLRHRLQPDPPLDCPQRSASHGQAALDVRGHRGAGLALLDLLCTGHSVPLFLQPLQRPHGPLLVELHALERSPLGEGAGLEVEARTAARSPHSVPRQAPCGPSFRGPACDSLFGTWHAGSTVQPAPGRSDRWQLPRLS